MPDLPIRTAAFALLADLRAPARLVQHAEWVGEAAEAIVAGLWAQGIETNEALVLAGAWLHDVGKVRHPEELSSPGTRHEASGEGLLLELGLPADLARICRVHGDWRTEATSLEELLVTLADKLWKGTRLAELELRVIDLAAERSGRERWELFVRLDSAFEEIASGGAAKLGASAAVVNR